MHLQLLQAVFSYVILALVSALLQLGYLLHLDLVQPALAQVSLHAIHFDRLEAFICASEIGGIDQVSCTDHGYLGEAELLPFVALGCQV